MFGRKKSAPEVSEKEIFDHIMSTLYEIGPDGTPVNMGIVWAARDLAKGEACEGLAALGRATPRSIRNLQADYDQVGNRIAAMFGPGGPYAGSVFGDQDIES